MGVVDRSQRDAEHVGQFALRHARMLAHGAEDLEFVPVNHDSHSIRVADSALAPQVALVHKR